MAKNNSTGIVEVKESEIRNYLDQQVKEAVKQVLEEIMNQEAEELLCAKHMSAARTGGITGTSSGSASSRPGWER